MAYNYTVMRLNAITMLPTFIGFRAAAAACRLQSVCCVRQRDDTDKVFASIKGICRWEKCHSLKLSLLLQGKTTSEGKIIAPCKA